MLHVCDAPMPNEQHVAEISLPLAMLDESPVTAPWKVYPPVAMPPKKPTDGEMQGIGIALENYSVDTSHHRSV